MRVVVLAMALGGAVVAPSASPAQTGDAGKRKAPKPPKAPKSPRPPTRFFDVEHPLPVTFTADLARLRRDKGEKAPWRAATVSYPGPDGQPVVVPVRARTRGLWRLKNCVFPPLRLDFAGKAVTNTVFDGLDKPKLVNYCRDNDEYEQYILQELQLYRVHALLTPMSHKARLVRATYVDSASGKTQATRYAIILEEPKALAERVGGRLVAETGAKADDLDPYNAALVGVFQYFIGNGDWSVAALHNAELVRDSAFSVFLVPYDFDYAGAVNARYATPDPQLPIKNVRQRIYRGHCAPASDYARVFALFNEKKSAIYALYGDEIGHLLEPRIAKQTLAYFDEFYRTINSPSTARRDILDACVTQQ